MRGMVPEPHFLCCPPTSVQVVVRGTNGKRKYPNRCAIAARPLKAGEVVLKNSAFAFVPQDPESRCACCLQQGKLLRCGRCKIVRYCSRECQKSDFLAHKCECTSSLPLGLEKEARLLLRSFIRSDCQGRKKSLCREHNGVVECDQTHIMRMAQSQNPLAASENDVCNSVTRILWKHREKLALQMAEKDIRGRLQRFLEVFPVNNFGITDFLSNVVAEGVFPLAASLNHSCAPNCLLRYTFGTSQVSPVLEIVANEDIATGEELTHSYVELVKPTSARQEDLANVHGFLCDCRRCVGQLAVPLPSGWLSRNDLSNWILQHYNPFVDISEQCELEMVPILMDEITRSLGDRDDIAYHLEKAAGCMIEGDDGGELFHRKMAVTMLAQQGVSLDLYRARGDLLGTLIVQGRTMDAVEECEHLVAYLCLAFHHVRHHPLLGLQLFTLGDLYSTTTKIKDAKLIYQWALQSLRISHGECSELVLALEEKLGRLSGLLSEVITHAEPAVIS